MNVILLCSGGLDSLTCLFYHIENGHKIKVLCFDYNQKNKKEISICKNVCKVKNIDFEIIKLKLNQNDPKEEIKNRNFIFISEAVKKCTKDFNVISIGIEPDSVYWDSSETFLRNINSTLNNSGISVIAPIKHLRNRREVIERALHFGLPLSVPLSSCSNKVDGNCSTSYKYLNSLKKIFPNIDPIILLKIIKKELNSSKNDSKFIGALFCLASLENPKDEYIVHDDGSWGNDLLVASKHMIKKGRIKIIKSKDLKLLKSDELSQFKKEAQWGFKQVDFKKVIT